MQCVCHFLSLDSPSHPGRAESQNEAGTHSHGHTLASGMPPTFAGTKETGC